MTTSTAELWRPKDGVGESLVSEGSCLELVDELFLSSSSHAPFGRGDDCAELMESHGGVAFSTDMFWEDVHFRTAYFTPGETGAKALTVAVSDLAAAGAIPLAFSMALMLPPWMGKTALRGLLAGMAEKARLYHMDLVGGDLSRGEKLGFSLSVWGKKVHPDGVFLRRGQAEAGDLLFLIGEAGLARVGLWALEKMGRAARASWPKACAAHLAPVAFLSRGQNLAGLANRLNSNGEAHRLSLMDLSDGIMRDVPRLLGNGNGIGADLRPNPRLIRDEIHTAARIMGRTPEELVLLGGEDYALIGSCSKAFWKHVRRAAPKAQLLGEVTALPGLHLRGRPLSLCGFDHFSVKDTGDEQIRAATGTLTRMCRDAWHAGLMAGFNGNASCRIALPTAQALGDACLITRSGAAKAHLTEEDFALLDPRSGVQLAGPVPSSESAVHLAIYAACPQSRVILHTHPPCLLALSLLLPPDERLVLPLPEAESYRARLGHANFAPPGSAELATLTAERARRFPAIWMERHGLVVHAKNASTALALTEELEQLARVHLGIVGKGEAVR